MPFEGIFFRKYEKKIDSATNGTHVQPRMAERNDIVSCTYIRTNKDTIAVAKTSDS